jgi:hypothetical protein
MNSPNTSWLLLAHAGFGVSGCLAALWVFTETLNARPGNAARIQLAAYVTAVCMGAAWVCGGYWYVHFYPADKALILKGPWPFAHNVFMETKEHLFFITGILALLLPLVTREKLDSNPLARKLVLSVAGLLVITGLAIEGAGGVISQGVKAALLQAQAGGFAQ